MKACGGCDQDFDEQFNFCPNCGRKFGGPQAEEHNNLLNQHLFNMKAGAAREDILSRRVFSGQGLGNVDAGRR